jgi:histidinol dehydrogenase
MQTIKYPQKQDWAQLLSRPTFDNSALTESVQSVLNDVKNRGDEAVKEYGFKFDKVELLNLQVTENEIAEAEKLVSEELKSAILLAKANIEKFHAAQKIDLPKVETAKGVNVQKMVNIK